MSLSDDDGQMVLIDFDDFGEGWHLFDLATVLFFFQPHPLYDNYREALLEGYGSCPALAGRIPPTLGPNAALAGPDLSGLGIHAQR